MRRSTYEDQIDHAVRVSHRKYKSPGAMFAAVLAALGETPVAADVFDRAWAEHYANPPSPESGPTITTPKPSA